MKSKIKTLFPVFRKAIIFSVLFVSFSPAIARTCYTLKDEDRGAKERVCKVMEENLNRFCDEPPMVCGLQIAPEFSKMLKIPGWERIDFALNRKKVEEILLRQSLESHHNDDKVRLFNEANGVYEDARRRGTLRISKSYLDLFNIKKKHVAYRIDFGNCRQKNPQLGERSSWGLPATNNDIEVQYLPNINGSIFRGFTPKDDRVASDVFIFDKVTYSFTMSGPKFRLGPNQFRVMRHQGVSLGANRYIGKLPAGPMSEAVHKVDVCTFNYDPT
jgi:hypothetical protein